MTTAVKLMKKPVTWFSTLFVLLALTGCYDQYAYEQTIKLKEQAFALMDSAYQDAAPHADKIDKLKTDIQGLYDYEKKRSGNDAKVKLWDKMMDENGPRLGGFLKRWESGETFSKAFIEQAKELNDEIFKALTDLETARGK